MRLDLYLTEMLGIETRSKAQNLIKLGRVLVNGEVADKAGVDVNNKSVELLSVMEYASMGGYKLAKAANEFGIVFKGLTVADIGASNGGFTSVLLQRDCAKVYAVDVGECALPSEIRNDMRVIVRDRTNARELKIDVFDGESVDAAVIDVSFISLKTVLQSVAYCVKNGGFIVALIKPQFEVGKKYLSKKGIVTDVKAREKAVNDVLAFAEDIGLNSAAITTAPIYADKNTEYLVLLRK